MMWRADTAFLEDELVIKWGVKLVKEREGCGYEVPKAGPEWSDGL